MTKRNKRVALAIIILLAIVIVSQAAYLLSKNSIKSFDYIGVIRIEDEIVSSENVIAQLKEYKNDFLVKAVVIRLDSPGGEVAPTQEIYEEVLKLRKAGKKTVASMAGTACSGAYYIACACDSIVANPGTITANIGVRMGFPNVEELMKKVGVKFNTIKSGAYKDMGSVTRTMSEEERQILQAVIDSSYHQFVTAVARGRGMTYDRALALADGRIVTGEMAKGQGMVDVLGNFEDSIELAKRISGVKDEPGIREWKEKKRKGLLERVLGDALGLPSRPSARYSLEYR
jgi:protease IV